MPIQLASYLIPKNGGSFFLLEDKHLKGSYRVVADTTARDAIPEGSLKVGCLVYTTTDNTFWQRTAEGGWSEVAINKPGPTGAVGPTGPVGATGNDGVDKNASIIGQFAGNVAPTVGTIRYYPDKDITIKSIIAWLSGPAGADVTTNVLVNGTVVESITIPAGSDKTTKTVSFPILQSEYVTLTIVGGSGSDLTVRLVY